MPPVIRVEVTISLDAQAGATARNIRAFVASLLPPEHPWSPRVVSVAFPWDGSTIPHPVQVDDAPSTRRQGIPR